MDPSLQFFQLEKKILGSTKLANAHSFYAACSLFRDLYSVRFAANRYLSFARKQCTMRFRKKRVKNVQLWTLVSPRIFIEKWWNFAQSCLNSLRIWGLFFWKKKLRKNWGKIQKPVGGVSSSQDWSQKNPLAKRIFFRKCTFWGNTPK